MKYTNPKVASSYRQNNLGKTLYNIVLETKPKKIIEFGTLNGYSTIAMAMALQELGSGKIISYDLWDSYEFKHGDKNVTQLFIDSYGLSDFIELKHGDFDSWKPEQFDLLHLDISNDGEILERAYKKLEKCGGLVIFEGGSEERDQTKWMVEYKKKPISKSDIKYQVLDKKFPSISKFI